MAWDLDLFISKLYARELLSEQVIKELCEKVKEVLINEGNVRHIAAPVTLVGDVHGQFYDVLEIFKIAGPCPSTNYVFLGDYVDRGYYSVETIALLTCLKLRYPDRVTLVRGNHESRAVTQTYGFYTECLRNAFTDMFDYLVLSVIIEDSIFCVHGGLSPSLHTIDQIKVIDRFREIPHEGPMADLVWSDPLPTPPNTTDAAGGIGFTGDDKGDFAISSRGAGYTFGREVTRKFLDINGLGHICRAHQLCMEGYQILYDDLLSTVWSAPNYCYRAGNLASVLEVGPGLERFFNVFGPCPDVEREFPGRESVSGGW
ncbi:Metallo-dependent phosphatase-like protein [Chytridium lagenaria]|nr:Metallo-dependent phosphatase-like protein [Chytridium lagenaria]